MTTTRENILGLSKACVGILLLAVIAGSLAFSEIPYTAAYASTVSVEKGLTISSSYVLGDVSGAPSFSQLKQAGFTLIGTVAYSRFTSSDWRQVAYWVKSAHSAGFTTFIDYWAENLKTATDMTKQAASTGTDLIALDELLSSYHFKQKELQSTIETGLKVNPKLSFILNEFAADQVRNAYAWTTRYASVRIATDNYYDKMIIDLGIKLGSTYGKKPAAWLIFCKGSQNFDSYTHLTDWISYAKQRNIDTYFWGVDSAGTWTTQWQQVVAF